jgi:hypothetical protein
VAVALTELQSESFTHDSQERHRGDTNRDTIAVSWSARTPDLSAIEGESSIAKRRSTFSSVCDFTCASKNVNVPAGVVSSDDEQASVLARATMTRARTAATQHSARQRQTT